MEAHCDACKSKVDVLLMGNLAFLCGPCRSKFKHCLQGPVQLPVRLFFLPGWTKEMLFEEER